MPPPSDTSLSQPHAHAPLRARPAEADALSRRVEILRLLAMVLLVGYHVVGSGPGAGLRLDYPHVLRVLADGLVEIRMPIFAFVAGFIYAIRPPTGATLGRFFSGKVQRLLLPGAVAATLFFLFAALTDSRLERGLVEIWRIYVYPYAHFWFLQSIFVIFVVHALLDAAAGRRGALIFAAAALALYFAPVVPRPSENVFSIRGAIYLAPYFAAGALWRRHADGLHARPGALLAVSLAALAVAVIWTVGLADESGRVDSSKRDFQSLLFGVAICAVGMAQPWTPRRLYALGAMSFTIYLYHVFGTSGMRRVLHALDIEGVGANLVLGTLAGLVFPIVLHLILQRWGPSRRIVLGIK